MREGTPLAIKQRIPQEWVRQRPNLAKLTHLYNLDDTVGLNCPNKKLDVMLLQFMLQQWSTRILQLTSPWYGFNTLPINGVFDNRLLAWIFGYQVMQWENHLPAISGKAIPIRGMSELNGRNVIADLNLQLMNLRDEKLGRLWGDITSVSGIPPELAQAVKQVR